MSVHVAPCDVVLTLAAIALVVRASTRYLMTKPLHRREASDLLSATALGLFVAFIFVIMSLIGTARAEARPSHHSQNTHRVVRDVTPLFAVVDTQLFSARRHHRRHVSRHGHITAAARSAPSCAMDNNGRTACGGQSVGSYEQPATNRRNRTASYDASGNGATIIPHPAGCGYRAFCGCGLRKYLGIADRSLDLAWNWARKFPRTVARVGAAAVWRHHVAYIQGGSPGNWLIRDYNSGGHQSRLHYRSLAGAVFVDPNGSRVTASYSARRNHFASAQ